jgi:hypothetical protein
VTDTVEDTARQIAEQGRDTLVERLRPAFKEAAAAHSDVLTLDDEQVERMVQRAADRADGLQWRRALASVASDQLGIGLGEALGHPAVARAQAIVGAPSYEDALAAVSAGQGAPAAPVETAEEPQPESAGPEALEPDQVHEAPPQAEGDEAEDDEPEDESQDDEPEAPEEPEDEDDFEDEDTFGEAPPIEPVSLKAVHLGGIANLREGAGDIELRFSEAGLDLTRGDQPLGRLTWREIAAVETPSPSGRRRRRQRSDGTIVIRSPNGSATFEIPGVTPEELHDHLAPLLEDR